MYYGDISDDTFCLLVKQMRPFGVKVIVYSHRTSLHHLESRGVAGYFMGPGDGPSMDRVYMRKGTGATVMQYRHVVTPLVWLEMHASLLHRANLSILTESCAANHLAGDQAALPAYARGKFEVVERDMREVPPHQNACFIQQVKDIATFDRARAAPATPASATVLSADWSQGEHPRLSTLHNQPGRTPPRPDCPVAEWPEGTARSPPP